MDRRLLLAWAFVPVAFYAYACGGDDDGAPPDNSSSSSGASSGASSGTSSSGGALDGGDQDSGNPLACIGNPLLEDAGTAEGGAVVSADAGAVQQIVIVADSFFDGPQYTELFGDAGQLVYSEVFGPNQPRIMRVSPDGS